MAGKQRPIASSKKDKKGKDKDKGWTCDLIPKELIVARYFAQEQAAIDDASAELATVGAEIAELEEEHGGDEGAFFELDKISKASVNALLKELKGDSNATEQIAILKRWLTLSEREAEIKRSIKDAEAALDKLAYEKYPQLTSDEIKTLAVDKWIASVDALVHGEMDRISQTLTGRVRELAERYAIRLPDMVANLIDLEAKVNAHLKRMGFAW